MKQHISPLFAAFSVKTKASLLVIHASFYKNGHYWACELPRSNAAVLLIYNLLKKKQAKKQQFRIHCGGNKRKKH